MKMFKRITATLVLVFSLCSIAWGESKYEKAVKCIQNNIKSLEIVGENEKTYDRLFHEENKLKTDDKLWCYTGKSDEKILLGHIPGNKDMEVGKNFEVKGDGLFFAFVLEPTHNRWVEIKDTLPEDKSPNERFCELLGIKRDFSEPLEIYIMLANVSDVYRPAYEPDIRKRINVEFVRLLGNRNSSLITQPLNVWGYQTKSNYAELKRLLRYWDTNTNCCTRLGYTFDYAEINDTIKEGYTKKDDTTKKSFIGVPEVIIRKGSTVKIIKKISIEDFHEEVNCNKNFEKYFCSICGYVYLPAEHDYITFEELPDDWHCPRCKKSKDKFNKSQNN